MTHRIVSLIARATEIVCALGLEDALVGRSHECDYPPSVARLPVCSTSKVKEEAHSEAIDRQVRRIVGDGLSVYQVDPDLLNRLAPTVIVTQIQCDVYAVSLKDVERAVCELVSSRPAIVSLEPLALSDVWRDKWIDPLMIAGNWVPELVDYSGGVDPLGGGKHSGYLDIAQLVAVDPGVIAIMPCGFDIERAWREMPALVSRPEWQQLSAVRSGRVVMTDGNQYFNRPGPRLMESENAPAATAPKAAAVPTVLAPSSAASSGVFLPFRTCRYSTAAVTGSSIRTSIRRGRSAGSTAGL